MDHDNDAPQPTDRAYFRQQNELLRAAVRGFIGPDDEAQPATHGFMCECSLGTCTESIDLTLEEYAAAVDDHQGFVVRPEHVQPATEQVVSSNDAYWVVVPNDRGA
jgi:hypothetical protein